MVHEVRDLSGVCRGLLRQIHGRDFLLSAKVIWTLTKKLVHIDATPIALAIYTVKVRMILGENKTIILGCVGEPLLSPQLSYPCNFFFKIRRIALLNVT